VKYCAHSFRSLAWLNRLLAFFGAAAVGLIAPTGCIMGPEGFAPSRASIDAILWGPEETCTCGRGQVPCGSACEEENPMASESPCQEAACPPPAKSHGWLHRFSKCHLYEPEAGIFNFCVPPACIQEPPPLPPGRFFPVPVRPVFSPQPAPGYALPSGP
jgi:hypothetical protein